jgi:hypothetical protein
MATTPSNSGGDDDDDRESLGSGVDEVEEEEGEDEQEGGDSENEEGEGGDEEEEEGEDGDGGEEEAEDFGSQRPEVLKKKPLPPEDDEGEAQEGGGDASSEEDEVLPTHDARKTAAAPPVTPPPATKQVSTPPPAPAKKKASSMSQPTLVSKLKPTKDRDDKGADAPAAAPKEPLGVSRPKGAKLMAKPKPAPPSAASSAASTASTASAKPNGKVKASSTSTTKPKDAPHKSAAKAAAAAKRFEQSDDEEDGVSGEEAEAEASLNRPGEGLAERRPPTLQDTHPDVHMEADAAREREAANTREPASRQSGPPAKHVPASIDQGAAEQTAVFKAVGLAHRWYKHESEAIFHQHTVGHEGDATPFEVPFGHYVEKGNNNRAAVQKQLLEAQPEKFVALVRIAKASASTGGYADNQYHASIPITVVDDESSPDLIRKFKESKPPDGAFGSNPQVHWPLEHKVVELAYAEPNCPLPSCCDPKNAPKGDPKNGPKFVLIPGQNQIPNMEEWTHVSASAGTKRPKGGIEGSKRQKTNQATLPFGAATAAAETGAPEAGAPAAPAVAGAAASRGAAGSSSDAVSGQADDPPYKKLHLIPVASAEKTTVTIVPGSNSVVVFEW